MQLNITTQKENILLKRKEIEAKTVFDKETPSNLQVQEKIAELLKIPKEQIAVKKISTEYGTRTANIKANAYDNAEAMKKAEPIKKEKTNKKTTEKK